MANFRILSFDGGGIRGALTSTLLKRLNREYPRLIEETDLFAGTSTGSFIALGLAYGLNVEEVADLYSIENSCYIFSPEGLGLFRPKYSNKKLADILLRIFPKELKLSDLNKYVVIPTFRINSSKKESWTPVFFNNFPGSKTRNVGVIDAALASSAAPIYFPSYKDCVDGGLIANNPCTAALSVSSDPFYANQKCEEISLLSIGTGFCPHKIMADTTRWGLFQWLFNKNPSFPLETIMFEGAVEADSYFSYQFLKERFHRLNPRLNKCIALNDYQEIPYLISLAENYDLTHTLVWLKNYWDSNNFSYFSSDKKNKDIDLDKARYWHEWHNKSF